MRIFASFFECANRIIMKIPLKEIADIRFGFYGKSAPSGKYNYIQAKYFDNSGIIVNTMDSFIDLEDKDRDHILLDGDILFVSKGFRYFSWCYRSHVGPAVASAIFFVIRPNQTTIIPEYLNTFFNIPKNQEFFKQFGAGSSIPSIRKSELESILIPVPEISDQQKIVNLTNLYLKDIALSNAILKSKIDLYQSVISNILI